MKIEKHIFNFDDISIVVLKDNSNAEVYVEVNSNLMYVFGVAAPDFKQIDIEALHEIGYFDNFINEEV